MIRYTDGVLQEIAESIGFFEPERGGALLGIPNTGVICKFVEDPFASVTATSYLPSEELQIVVTNEELRTGLTFCGIVHSHPGSFSSPSQQDHIAFKAGLDRNPHIASFVAPIVTLTAADRFEEHEIPLPSVGKLSNYVAYRTKSDLRSILFATSQINIANEAVRIIPLHADFHKLVDELFRRRGERPIKTEGLLDINGTHHFTITLTYQAFELIALIPPIYPLAPPSILLTDLRAQNSTPKPLPLSWTGALTSQLWMSEVENAILDFCGNESHV
jgi:proteasome lid subunit RPN8/RPN11